MIKSIMDAIAIRLHEVFGDEYKIYQNEVKQGLKEPCFLISLITTEKTPLLGMRSSRTIPFDIHYFPKNNEFECYTVSEKLMDELEQIKTIDGDLFNGTKMHGEVIDGVLHFFVNFNFTVLKTEEFDHMDDISVSSNVKG